MQISGQPLPDCCLLQEWGRGGWGRPEPKLLGARGKHPVHKTRNTPLGAGPIEGSTQSQAPPYLYTGALVAALKNSSEDLKKNTPTPVAGPTMPSFQAFPEGPKGMEHFQSSLWKARF